MQRSITAMSVEDRTNASKVRIGRAAAASLTRWAGVLGHAPGTMSGVGGGLTPSQYTVEGLEMYEAIFGRGFLSSGGVHTTKNIVPKLNLKPGEKVLDVGSGLGGSAFYMAQHYGCHVVGVDLSSNMVRMCRDHIERLRTEGVKCELTGELVADMITIHEGNIFEIALTEAPFDAAYSRDCIIHIGDKPTLFKRIFDFLRPGGRLLITDYAVSDPTVKPHSQGLLDYIADRTGGGQGGRGG